MIVIGKNVPDGHDNQWKKNSANRTRCDIETGIQVQKMLLLLLIFFVVDIFCY